MDELIAALTEQEKSDLQAWLRHGRIGIGRWYQEEVSRAHKLDAERALKSRATSQSGE